MAEEAVTEELQALAKKGMSAEDPSVSWVWRLVSTVVFFATLWWTKHQLSRKEQELARAKAELEKLSLQKAKELFAAEHAQLSVEFQQTLRAALKEIDDSYQLILKEEATYKAKRSVVEKIEKWEDLNKIAGVE